ncbi:MULTISPECIES: type II CRISPR RNA-guided endonuclease Cas9 [unclassified Helicobacter]|uniref:type II CRISPR RNA-guided endonuclease Cas9 n=1 Tax=unclassified Helicobacter TaxID=2593540 RepID=UPI000CF0E7C0|nr:MULTISPECIES: type II CRISPR RNA-guided endonuclease Cas9 [unclassified Helicobacter]
MGIKTLGVDIGIASIGWALIEQNEKDIDIIDSGVRIFTKAEHPKDKSSLALPRRIARGARRRNQRRKARILQVKKYLIKALNLPSNLFFAKEDSLPPIFETSKDFISPWQLRLEALKRKLKNEELARVILHITKRRGYDDITYGLEDSDSGKILKAINENRKELLEGKYETIGSMMCEKYFQKKRKDSSKFEFCNVRNRGEENYNRCIGRSDLKEELEIILERQKKFGNEMITQEFERELLGDRDAKSKQKLEGLIFYQRPLKSFEDKVGKCQFFATKERACKNSPSAERFVALTKILNTLLYISKETGIVWDKPAMIAQILEKAKSKKRGINYQELREMLELPQEFQFRDLVYESDKTESKTFIALENTLKLLAANPDICLKTQDEIAQILGKNKDWEKIARDLASLGLTKEQIQNIKTAKLSFSKHLNLSLEALGHLIPLMEKGIRYDEALKILEDQKIIIPRKALEQDFLPPLKEIAKQDSYFDITNPVVNRALSEFRKVFNAIVKKHGSFHYLNIELAREVGLSKKQRGDLEKSQKDNEAINLQAIQEMKKHNLTKNDILKFKLWILQNEQCIYSGKKITIQHLLDEKMLDIDHYFPLSRSLDDSQMNKVLCFRDENQNKLNKTPFEFFGSDEKRWNEFVARVFSTKYDKKKKMRIISKSFKERKSGEKIDFLTRNLVDTGYINRVVSLYVKNYFKFLPLDSKRDRIRVVSGSLTSAMRSYWGLVSKNRDHHLHHAQDAIIIACINDSVIQKYSKFLQDRELAYKETDYKIQKLNKDGDYMTKLKLRYPIPDFKIKIEESIKKIIVSHNVSQKISGALHKETIRKRSEYYKRFGGEIGLQKAIKYGKVREVNGGIVDNGEMVRVDIFRSKDRGLFYVVPVYTFDFAKKILPNRAIVSGKNKDGVIKDWIEMNENYDFCFSLFKNDCVLIQAKGMQEPILAIYKSTDTRNASLSFEHLSKYELKNESEEIFFKKENKKLFSKTECGIQKLQVFKKVKISPLGEIKELGEMKRVGIINKNV